MKLSEKTKLILNNFQSINDSLVVFEGSRQKTMNIPQKTILADATLDESFPQDFGIYDLGKFLSLVSLFKDPEITFEDKYLILSEGTNQATFTYCETKLLKAPPKDKELPFNDVKVSFTLTNEVFSRIQKAAKVLGNNDLVLEGKDRELTLTVKNLKDTSADTFVETVGESIEDFKYGFDISVLKFIPTNYDVSIAENGMSKFESKDLKLVYWMPTQKA